MLTHESPVIGKSRNPLKLILLGVGVFALVLLSRSICEASPEKDLNYYLQEGIKAHNEARYKEALNSGRLV